MINIKLNIFFYCRLKRIKFLKENFKIKNIDKDIKQVLTTSIDGLISFKLKNSFKNIPGYWIEFNFSNDEKGKNLYENLILTVPCNKIDDKVFYPTISLPKKQLQINWTNKYNFSLKDQNSEKWNIFFKELKIHIKYKRMNNVFVGLNLILKYNPFFLKRYKRYYIFEELAYYYEQQGNLTKAIKCLKLQSVLNPNSAEPYLNMSSFYIVNGMEEEAIDVCRAGLRKSPDDQYLISNLVIALSNIGNYEHAFIFLKEVLDDEKNNALLWKLMGDLCYEMDYNREAIKCYKIVLEIKSKNIENMHNFYGEVYNSIAACYFEEEKYKEAIRHYKRALSYNPNDTYTILSLSQIYLYYLSDVDTSLKYTKMLVNEVPDSGFGQYQLGIIYLEQGHIEKSKWHLYKARRLMPNYAPIHDAIEAIKKTYSVK